ncbi:Pentatricopeptide repeat-containing protein [Acorus calamus]|uniref:Pentatricopeptide repeat-containing protein n=1 Tax=Acorus calamus TaxID=4465 RepID=A0AAV9EYZ2_ACOCL|nr:Pentatricopeptide repeat-containing protein [Acorus calamus]
MWALRRAANPLRNHGYHFGATRASFVTFNIFNVNVEHDVHAPDHGEILVGSCLLPRGLSVGTSMTKKFFVGSRDLSSHAGKKTTDEIEEGFSDLGNSFIADIEAENDAGQEKDEELMSGEHADELPGEASDHELPFSDSESVGTDKEKQMQNRISDTSPLFEIILETPRQSVKSAIDKWVQEGNSLERTEYYIISSNLRRRRFYGKALELSDWVEKKKDFDFMERDYASRTDLIAKVFGMFEAEKYVKNIPESFQGELVYRTLLANCVFAFNTRKAEEIVNKIKQLKLPISTFVCNQLLMLYNRSDRSKVQGVLKMMEKENVKPSSKTYSILINIKGRAGDIDGMEKVIGTMKADAIETNFQMQAMVAKHYISAGLTEKAEEILKEMEAGDLKKNRGVCKDLLRLYASLNKPDEVARVWEIVKPTPYLGELLSLIEAWGKLGRVEEAEAVFETILKTWKKPPPRSYTILMSVYANHGLLSKGKELAKNMSQSGASVGPLTWDALVKLYVGAGELEKADSILHKAAEQNPKARPLYNSYLTIMNKYAMNGDVHNTEKIFHRMRRIGYTGGLQQYHALLQAYLNANMPPYGFRERMKADNRTPSKAIIELLSQSDPFKKTSISELLD